GEIFLFKSKFPENKIIGAGFFVAHANLPLSVSWDVFKEKNGYRSYSEFKRAICLYRKDNEENPVIGCITLTNPIFFDEIDKIPPPEGFAKNIVQGKTYSVEELPTRYWDAIQLNLSKYLNRNATSQNVETYEDSLLLSESIMPYYSSYLQKVRIGQGAFRVMLIDRYERRCAISGEKTLPVLEAAHIKPYADNGPNATNNGLLLRSDLHKLFDDGYLTITEKMSIKVSRRIKEEFENGKDYYKFDDMPLRLPKNTNDIPRQDFVSWHNENIYRG
ncbi:MAG: HNH endonuclease, partial [Chitinophagia bacterium]|nr:HNH endonuclease [Chitinophagia bacterium]